MSCSSQADSPTAMARAAATERTLTEERMGIPFSRAGDGESIGADIGTFTEWQYRRGRIAAGTGKTIT